MEQLRVNRRAWLGLGGAAGLPLGAKAAEGQGRFAHGVASGDPLADRVLLWTRYTPPAGRTQASLRWEVATDPGFGRIVAKGRADADLARDFTIKVDAAGLKPGQTYFYRFRDGAVASPTGRTRTLPTGALAEARLAFVSCQLHPGGLFNAYEALARVEGLDAVVHLGDYIYEYGAEPQDYGMATGARLGRVPDPPQEIVSLADYRRRHAQYRSDPDLQAAHAAAPFICVWDDHELTNDGWLAGAQNHQPETEGDFAARKAAALQAYFEWMPIREPSAARARDAIQRRFTFGDLADLIMVETRLGARTEQLSLAKDLTWRGEGSARTPDLQSFQAKLADPSRQLMGGEQMAWLERELAGSRAAGRPWQVLGNQVVMARVAIPDARKILAPDKLQALLASLSPEVRPQVERSMALAQFGAPFTLDSWDGYPAERERLYQAFRRAGVRPVVVSGDSHAFWVNDLAAADGGRAAVEFGTTAISSPSPGDQLPGFPLGEALAAGNPEVVFCDQRSKGFLVLRLTREAAHAELHAVSRIDAKPFDTTVVKRFRVPAGQGGPQEA